MWMYEYTLYTHTWTQNKIILESILDQGGTHRYNSTLLNHYLLMNYEEMQPLFSVLYPQVRPSVPMNSSKLLVINSPWITRQKSKMWMWKGDLQTGEKYWQVYVGDGRDFKARVVNTLYMHIWQWQRKTLIRVT